MSLPLRRQGRVFEDFVPISDSEALVTVGRTLDRLSSIMRVGYEVHDGAVVLAQRGDVVLAGLEGVRLGGMFDGQLVYSEAAKGVMGWPCSSPGAHQPFVHEGSVYYTDEWPYVTIHKDGARFLGHFDKMAQVSNPCWVGDVMYFEARDTVDPRRPDAWQVWRMQAGGEPEFVCQGANPATWNGRVFVGEWRDGRFEYRCLS